jgi:hypothetical protein
MPFQLHVLNNVERMNMNYELEEIWKVECYITIPAIFKKNEKKTRRSRTA